MEILIVGVNKGDSGRLCKEHNVCREGVRVCDVLFFEPFVNGSEYMVRKGRCIVGYLKLDVARDHPAYYFSKRLSEVLELYSDDRDKINRHFSCSFCGIAWICLYPESFTKTDVVN